MDICHGSDLSVPQVVDGAVEVGGLADRGDDQAVLLLQSCAVLVVCMFPIVH